MTITQTITLDTLRENAYKVVYAKQYDEDSRFLKITMTQAGEPIEAPSGCSVIISAERSDGAKNNFSGTRNSDGTVTVPLANWMLLCPGVCMCCVSIIKNDEKLSTLNFALHVEYAPTDNNTITEDENYNVLVDLINQVNEATTGIEAAVALSNDAVALAAAVTAAETAQGKAEDAQTAAETAQGKAEDAQEAAETAQGKAEDAQEAAEAAAEAAESAAESAVADLAAEIEEARGDEESLGDRLSAIQDEVSGGVPDDLDIEGGKIYLSKDGVTMGDGVTLPESGAQGLDYENVEVDGSQYVRLWLTDKNGEEIEDSDVQFPAGGGGGGGGSSYVTRVFNELDSNTLAVTSGQACDIQFSFKEMYGTEQTSATGTVVYSYSHDGTNYTQLTSATIAQDTIITFDVTDFLVTGTNYLKVTVTGGEGQVSRTITYSITLIECKMYSNFNPINTYTGNFALQFSCVGRGLDKTVYIKIDGTTAYTVAYGTGSSNSGLVSSQTISTSGWAHGVHTLEMYFTAAGGVESPHLKYDVLFSTESTTPLLGVDFGYTEVTYGDIVTCKYVVYTANNSGMTNGVTRRIYKMDGDDEVDIAKYDDTNILNNVQQSWTINFSGVGMPETGTVYVELSVTGGNTKTFPITISEFTSDYSIQTVSRRLIAYIAPTGQSNSEANKNTLNAVYTDNNGTETTIPVTMTDFNFTSNGFLSDANGNYFIRMSGDARLRIDLPLFVTSFQDAAEHDVYYDGSVQSKGRTAEFRFKVSKVTNSKAPIISCFTATTDTTSTLQGAGFVVTPKSAYIMCNGQSMLFDSDGNVKNPQGVAVTNFCEDEIIRLSFVVEGADGSATGKQAIKIYLNGELTRIVPYETSATFSTPAYIELGSSYCVLDLYSCDFYDTYLSDSEIMQNSFSDLASFADRVAKFEENDVDNDNANGRGFYHVKNATRYVNNDDMLDYYACRTRIPCILTTGVMSPTKGTKTNVGLIFTLPADNEDGYEVLYSGMEQVGGAYLNQTNVQGTTSSQLYPRFNYKLTFRKEVGGEIKKQKVKFKKGNNIGESTLCWKADMMSPDHANTVNAIFFDDLFTEKIPPAQNNADIHPMVYGYRCLLFNRADAEDDTPINFLGDGCINNDKGNTATFGLSNTCDSNASDSYWSEHGMTVTVGSGNLCCINADGDAETKCQKWEFKDNSPLICNFKSDEFYNGSGEAIVKEALESCYPDEGDLEDEGIEPNYAHIQLLYLWVLKRANFWMANKKHIKCQSTDANKLEVIADSGTAAAGKIKLSEVDVNKNVEGTVAVGDYVKLASFTSTTYNGNTYTTEYDLRKAIFTREFTNHFHKGHSLSYFIAVLVTGLVDNYAKNMFLTTYDTLADQVVFTTEANNASVNSLHSMMAYAKTHGGNIPENFIDWDNSAFAIWYPTMYDLDSCYGVDNKGYRWIPYYADWDYYKWNDSNEGYIFNGATSYLWRMVHEALYGDIKSKFNSLANSTSVTLSDGSTATALSIPTWEDKMIKTNIKTVPVRITTEDSIFKYVMPWLYGYVKGAGDQNYSATSEFLYLVQSNKELQDKDFMNARMNMLYSEFESNAFLSDALTVLLPRTSFSASDVTLTLTPSQNMYCKVRYDTNASFVGVKAEEGEAVVITAPTQEDYSEATVTIAGASLLSAISGLEKLKGTSYTLGNATRLRSLVVGSTASDYTNPYTSALTVSACEMLEEINVAHLTALQTLDLSNCSLLKEVEARGCSLLSSIKFPVGGYLETLHLPALSNLTLRGHEELTDFTMTTWTSGTNTYTEDYSNLATLYLEGNMPIIPIGKILYGTLTSSNGTYTTSLNGLRLVNSIIDMSDLSDAEAAALIEALAGDTFYDKQIDENGDKVDANASLADTHYPIITGQLIVGSHTIDDTHDALLLAIMNRYPRLVIQAPAPSIDLTFNSAKCYELRAITEAARRGEVDIRSYFSVGDGRKLTLSDSKQIIVQIAGFWQGKDPEGNAMPLAIVMKNAKGSRAMNSNQKYIHNVKVDDTAETSTSTGTSSWTFTYQCDDTNAHDVEIQFVGRTLLTSIVASRDLTSTTWYFDNRRDTSTPANKPSSGLVLGQEDIKGDAYTGQTGIVSLEEQFTWEPDSNPKNALVLDGTNGKINVINRATTTTGADANTYQRTVEFKAGSKITMHGVKNGDTITFNYRAFYNNGGYFKSEMCTYLEGTFWNTLPENWRNLVRARRMYANIGGLSTDVDYKDVKISLLTYNDAGAGSTSAAYANETAANNGLALFSSNNSRIKYQSSDTGDATGSAVNWWLSSANANYANGFSYVNTSGTLSVSYSANISFGVVARFDI